MINSHTKDLLQLKASQYNRPEFIENDPIFVPHQFTKKEDIEIAGFFAAIFAWGQRKTIINKSLLLMKLMDNDPHDFITNHSKSELKNLLNFKHRTFNFDDSAYFVQALKNIYTKYGGLENALLGDNNSIESALIQFENTFFSFEKPEDRTKKHIASPKKNSACKRLNMYLRWMVRKDSKGVDFGIWNKIHQKELICPMDVHVFNTATKLNLMNSKKPDWNSAVELTETLKQINADDPVLFDFALFGLGIEKYFD